ncbi:MAG: InlB B-repeat-containing protein [Eubacterium sp.]|nr:InlB B-repeat-containing protein [Eubacterium sp.]
MKKTMSSMFRLKKRNGLGLAILLIIALLSTMFPPAEMFRVKEAKAASEYAIDDYNTALYAADLPKKTKTVNRNGYYLPEDKLYFYYKSTANANTTPPNLGHIIYKDWNDNTLFTSDSGSGKYGYSPVSVNLGEEGCFYIPVKNKNDGEFVFTGDNAGDPGSGIATDTVSRDDFINEFGCWTLDVTAPDATGQLDFTFTAKRKSDLYTITYLNYDDSTPKSELPPYYIPGTGIPELPDTFKSGYNFEGWFDENNQKVTSISTDKTGNITLTARFSPVGVQVRPAIHEPRVTPVLYKYYGITYVMDGGTNDSRNPTSYREDETVTLYDAWKTGATFDGWFLKPNGTGRVVTISGKNLTIYAHFKPYRYKIDYVLYGGIMEWGNPDFYEYGRMPTFEVEPTRENSLFVGWSMSPDGSNPFRTLPDGTTGDLTLYAVYQPIYHITYELDGGENNPGNPDTYSATDTVTLQDPIKSGSKFTGWFDAPTGGNRVTTVAGRDAVVYARFVPAYNIYYDLKGGENNPNNPDYYEVGKGALLADPHRRGYDFKGWVIAGTDTLTHSVSATQTGDVTLQAKWKPVPDLYGATVYLDDNRELVYNATGQSVSLKKIVTRDGTVIKSFKNCKVSGLTACDAGTHEVTIKGDGDRYTGKCSTKFKIAKANFKDAEIQLLQNEYYFEPGVKNKPKVEFYLNGNRVNTDLMGYNVQYCMDVVHAGEKWVVVRTTKDCKNLTVGKATVTYEVKKSATTFTANVDPDTFSIRKLRYLRQVAHVSVTDLSRGSEPVRFSIYSCTDSDKMDYVSVNPETGKIILLPGRWGECTIKIKCTSEANSDRKKKVRYVTINIE